MFQAVILLLFFACFAIALYSFIRKGELDAQVSVLMAEAERLRAELAKLDMYRDIPDVIEKARRVDKQVADKLERVAGEAAEIVHKATGALTKAEADAANIRETARRRATEVVAESIKSGQEMKERIVTEAGKDGRAARDARQDAQVQAARVVEEAKEEAKRIASRARKEAKEKTRKVEETLERATACALEIRERAEMQARMIAGKAYDSLKDRESNEATALAMRNAIDGYREIYTVPAEHVLDDLAYDYGFHHAGERLKVARDRARIMERNGTAADCNYPVGWKRDYAIDFILGAFNGKVDALLARIKPAGQGKLIQEIKDIFAVVNLHGEVFRNARIRDEYLDARMEELKWGVAVQKLKEKDRDEQRAIREQMREEEKAKKEYERVVKQAQREEEIIAKAIEKARQEHASANAEDRAKYDEKLSDLAEKLREAEEKNRRAVSMAQQTKCGHVYVISNVGSFGEDVYKIGLTRRIEPMERVRELGDASVPFGFDVHALIRSEDAPALESALHRRFARHQVNKVNRRKEFFRLKLRDVRAAIEEMGQDVRWTIAAEAKDFRETLAMERRMSDDSGFRSRWEESQGAFESPLLFDEEDAGVGMEIEEAGAVLGEDA